MGTVWHGIAAFGLGVGMLAGGVGSTSAQDDQGRTRARRQ